MKKINKLFEGTAGPKPDVNMLLEACDALYVKWPDATNALRDLFMRDFRRRWIGLFHNREILIAISSRMGLCSHLVALAIQDTETEDGVEMGERRSCTFCKVAVNWPGDDTKW